VIKPAWQTLSCSVVAGFDQSIWLKVETKALFHGRPLRFRDEF
jgi:hypothetical protein